MPNNIKVALQVPHPLRKDLFFSCTIKSALHNEPSRYHMAEKIIVLSEIGCSFQNLCKTLARNNVIDKYLNWIFGDGHLVILGNCSDCSGDAIECLWFLYSLEDKARKNGGYIHLLLGKTEIETLNKFSRFSQPRYAINNSLPTKLSTILYDGNNQLFMWLQTKNFFEKIGNILFSYGVVAENMHDMKTSISKINSIVKHYYIPKTNYGMKSTRDTTAPNPDLILYKESEIHQSDIRFMKRFFEAQIIVLGCISSKRIQYMFDNSAIGVNMKREEKKKEALAIHSGRYYRVDKHGIEQEIELQQQ